MSDVKEKEPVVDPVVVVNCADEDNFQYWGGVYINQGYVLSSSNCHYDSNTGYSSYTAIYVLKEYVQ